MLTHKPVYSNFTLPNFLRHRHRSHGLHYFAASAQKVSIVAMIDSAHDSGAPESMSSHGSSSSSNERKRPRILSTIGSTNSASHDPSDAVVPEVRKLEHEVYKKPEAIQRNKRIFGALMGHLGIAKRKLEEDSLNIDKQTSLQIAVSNKNGLENRRLQQLQREASDAQKAKERALREIFQLRQTKLDVAAASTLWNEKIMKPLSKVLITQSIPRLCWLPSAHNERTKKMLDSRADEIALEISERRQADAAIIQQTDEELANLQSLVSANSYSSEPVVAVDEVSKASDADPVVPLSTVAMTGGELTEYMLRIRNRRALNLKDDSTSENRATVDGQSRRNWSLDEEHNNGPSREAGNNYPYASSNRKEERGGPAHEGRSLSGSNFSNADRTVGHGKSGDHARSHNDQSSNWGRDRERERDLRGGSSTSASSSRVIEEGEDAEEPVDQEDVIEGKSRNSEHIPGRSVGSRLPRQTEAVVAEEEYVQDETEVDGEVDEEEDEAELLLAALGGRKH